MYPDGVLDHQSADEAEDGVEFRESGVDKGIGEYIVTLAYTYNTVCANLALTDGGDHTNKTYAKADAKDY